LIHSRVDAPRHVRLLLLGVGVAVATVALLLVPRAAHASFVDCVGATTHVDKTDRTQMAFNFHCSEEIKGYSVVSSQQLDTFSTENDVVDQSGATLSKESFSCEGSLPAFGFGCDGDMLPTHTTNGTYSTASDPCGKAAATARFRLWVVVYAVDQTGDGKTVMRSSNPFALAAPKCRKPHTKTKSKTKKRRGH
jgi:hypothetical protein